MDIRHTKKKEKLKSLLGSYKLTVFPRRNIQSTYLNFMKEIEHSKSYFTSKDLAKITGRAVGSCRNVILKYKKLKLIKCTQPYISSNYPEDGRYVVV